MENFKHEFEKSLLHKTMAGLLALGLSVLLVSILPMAHQLKSKQSKSLVFAAQTRKLTVEQFLDKVRETARQVTSRSRIRQMLEDYNRGWISLAALRSFTAPKLEDAMRFSGSIVGISRFDAHQRLVVRVGKPIPAGTGKGLYRLRETVLRGPVILDGKPYLLASAPILNRQRERVGSDQVLFSLTELQRIMASYQDLGKSGETLLLHQRNGQWETLFPCRDPGRFQEDLATLPSSLHRSCRQGEELGPGAACPEPAVVEGSSRLIAYDCIHGLAWTLLVRMDTAELFQPVNHHLTMVAAVCVLLILLGALGVWSILRPLADKVIIHAADLEQELTAKAKALQERQQIEQALFREQEQLGVTLASINEAVISADICGRIALFNPAAEQLTGWSWEDARGRRLDQVLRLLAPVSRQPLPVLGEDDPGPDACLLLTRDGEEKTVQVSRAQIRDRGREAARGLVLVARDISEQQRLESQLRQASKLEAIGRLAGGVAHDFNNLLTSILGYSDLMLRRMRDDSPLRPEAEAIQEAGRRAAALTRQLLAFSRKQELVKRPVDLNAVIQDMSKMLARVLGEDLLLELDLAAKPAVVLADPSQLEQVLMNLAVNAKDAMNCGGRLIIATRNIFLETPLLQEHQGLKPGAYLVLTVSDTGLGMSAKTRERIFEPFFTTKELGRGTGLGLATVYGIVQQHQGGIIVYSEPGAGTTFKIYLPATEVSPEPLVAEEPAPLPPGSETVLVVDDEPGVRALVRDVLEPLGYRVLDASCGSGALEILRSRKGDVALVLTDVVMPGISGQELAETIAALWPATRILFMSGYPDQVLTHQGLLAGNGQFLNKPLMPGPLAAKVRQVLDLG